MHIVALAWLFVVFTMALTLPPLAGVALLVVGAAPVALAVALAARRQRRSVLEDDVRERDDGEA